MESILSSTDALRGQETDSQMQGTGIEEVDDDSDDIEELHAPTGDEEAKGDADREAEEAAKKKIPVWKKPEKKKKGGGKKGGKQKAKAKAKNAKQQSNAEEGGTGDAAKVRNTHERH